jgi:hypothetical protein
MPPSLPRSKQELQQSTLQVGMVRYHGQRLRSPSKCSSPQVIPVANISIGVASTQVIKLTNVYPKLQLVRIIPIVTLMLAEPNIWPTTVGIMETIPPTVNPEMRTNRIVTPRVLANGQITNMLVPSSPKQATRTFKGPTLSLMKPEVMRPKADDALKPATKPAPTPLDRPIDSAKVGMQ